MKAASISPAEWRPVTVPSGTVSRSDELGLSTAKSMGAELAYARGGVPRGPLGGTAALVEGDRSAVPRVIRLPGYSAPKQKFVPLSRREGVVLEVRDDEFDARLVDLDGSEGDLDATFATEELSPDDVSLLRVGAVFYWTIGYFDDQVRRRSRVSDLRFRRLPSEDPEGIADAEAEADQILRDLGLA
jgi:hypothetical protein